MKKGVGSGSIIQKHGSGNPDPDPGILIRIRTKNFKDPQHWFLATTLFLVSQFDE